MHSDYPLFDPFYPPLGDDYRPAYRTYRADAHTTPAQRPVTTYIIDQPLFLSTMAKRPATVNDDASGSESGSDDVVSIAIPHIP